VITQLELEYLRTVHHPHLAKLVGFCVKGNCMMLIYEYTASISLNKFLIGKDSYGDFDLFEWLYILISCLIC
jgi:serine/threonine protein kinase